MLTQKLSKSTACLAVGAVLLTGCTNNASDALSKEGKGDEKFIYREFGREPYEGDNAIAREVLQKYYFNPKGDLGYEDE